MGDAALGKDVDAPTLLAERKQPHDARICSTTEHKIKKDMEQDPDSDDETRYCWTGTLVLEKRKAENKKWQGKQRRVEDPAMLKPRWKGDACHVERSMIDDVNIRQKPGKGSHEKEAGREDGTIMLLVLQQPLLDGIHQV